GGVDDLTEHRLQERWLVGLRHAVQSGAGALRGDGRYVEAGVEVRPELRDHRFGLARVPGRLIGWSRLGHRFARRWLLLVTRQGGEAFDVDERFAAGLGETGDGPGCRVEADPD